MRETVAEPSSDIVPDRPPVPVARKLGALADAITRAWRPYRWRAYVVGIVSGVLIAGVPTAIATTALAVILALAGITVDPRLPWAEVIWSVAFVVAFAAIGAWALARWLPARFKAAAETYVWLATTAETRWRDTFGDAPVPRTPESMRAFLDATPRSPETAYQRFGIYLALGELETARSEIEHMPVTAPVERYQRAAATWLLDFVNGGNASLEPLRMGAAAIDDAADRLEAEVEVALSEARVAVARGGDWMTPAAAIRDRLGTEPSRLIWRLTWRPAFRTMLATASVGVVAYWIILSAR